MPRSLRRASKRPKQPNPRQPQQPRARRQQLNQPVRLRLRSLPQLRLLEQPNLPLRPRLLHKFWLFSLRSLLPKFFGRRLLLYRCELNDEARMSNDEGNPNDESQKKSVPVFRHLSFVINSAFVIRISSFPKTLTWRRQLHTRSQKLAA